MANVNPYTSDVYVDMMQYETERDIERIKKRLATEYKQAEKELNKRWKQYTKKFEIQDKEKAKQVKSGALSEDDYIAWRKKRILESDALKQQVDRMSDYIINTDQQSADIVNGKRYGVYANNYNYARYEVEKGFHIDTSFSLFDQKTVERLAKDNPKMLPTVSPDKIKGKKWSKRAINNAISQGVLQGKSLPEVAKNLERVVGMEWNSAVRSARTAMTGAQNAGRVASYMDAEKLGINLQKQWVATLDERTRSSHASLDGESVPVDKKFSNGLMFPADPEGKPAEVYNCRCTLIADLLDYPRENFQRYDNIDGKPIDYVTYDEWKASKSIKTITDDDKSTVKSEIQNTFKSAYEHHRTENGLRSVAADDLPIDFFATDIGNIDERVATTYAKALKELTDEYDTTLCKMTVMSRDEYALLKNTFARTHHDYTVDTSTIMLNPVKMSDYEKLVARITELNENGYAARVSQEYIDRYVITHEFAHTLLDMQTPLTSKTNWVNANYDKIKNARSKIKSIYEEYIAELGRLEKQKKFLEMEYILGNADAGEKARRISKKISNIKISRYSMENPDEFLAEAFTESKLGKPKSVYAKRVMSVIDKYFGRRKK